jgi:gliding motility-associated-like protein
LNTGSATLAGVLGGDNVKLVSLSAAGVFESKNVGIGKNVSATGFALDGTGVDNYALIQPVLKANISPKALTIIAKEIVKPYGATIIFNGNEVTTVGLAQNDPVPVVKISSPGSIASAKVGTYPISVSGATDSNYTISYVDGKLTLSKEILTVEADSKSRVYGSENPAFTLTYKGFLNEDDASALDVLAVGETSADTKSDVGEYDINVSGASDTNYIFIYKKGSLTITKADQSISFESIPRRLRITQESRLIATASSGLPVSFETSDPDIGKVDGNILKVRRDGRVTVSASQAGDHNFNAAPDVAQTIETLPTFDGISSLFTPNNDGMNDYWYIPKLDQYGKLQVTVYNRFGQLVYRSDGYKNDWDGTWKGSPLPSASYYYIIRSSTKGFFKGVVNIAR